MEITQSFLPVGPARPGAPLDEVRALVLHWPAASRQTARQVRDFWAGPGNTEGTSAHCAVSQDGTIVQAIPWTEKAYHVGSSAPDPASGRVYTELARTLFGDFAKSPKTTSPNHVTIGIEMCHLDALGTYAQATVDAAVELCAYLCKQYGLDPASRIITHRDVVGWKLCPKWYCDHPGDLDDFRGAVAAKM